MRLRAKTKSALADVFPDARLETKHASQSASCVLQSRKANQPQTKQLCVNIAVPETELRLCLFFVLHAFNKEVDLKAASDPTVHQMKKPTGKSLSKAKCHEL